MTGNLRADIEALTEQVRAIIHHSRSEDHAVESLVAWLTTGPLFAAHPAASSADEQERAILDLIGERDRMEEVADALAAAIAPPEVLGEHSSANDPWQNALEYAADHPAEESAGIRLFAAERRRQVDAEGYTAEHDAGHAADLAAAAVCYATPEWKRRWDGFSWPWDYRFWKPTPNDRVRELVKAGALLAAAVDDLLGVEVSDRG